MCVASRRRQRGVGGTRGGSREVCCTGRKQQGENKKDASPAGWRCTATKTGPAWLRTASAPLGQHTEAWKKRGVKGVVRSSKGSGGEVSQGDRLHWEGN